MVYGRQTTWLCYTANTCNGMMEQPFIFPTPHFPAEISQTQSIVVAIFAAAAVGFFFGVLTTLLIAL